MYLPSLHRTLNYSVQRKVEQDNMAHILLHIYVKRIPFTSDIKQITSWTIIFVKITPSAKITWSIVPKFIYIDKNRGLLFKNDQASKRVPMKVLVKRGVQNTLLMKL